MIKLPENTKAGILELSPLRTVNHKPPKNKMPNKIPANNTNIKPITSFIIIVIFPVYVLVFFLDPVPGKNTSDHQSCYQKTYRPGKIIIVRSEERRVGNDNKS